MNYRKTTNTNYKVQKLDKNHAGGRGEGGRGLENMIIITPWYMAVYAAVIYIIRGLVSKSEIH